METQESVVGLDEGHLCSDADAKRLTVSVHRDVVEPFRKLHNAAAADGFDLAILSGFRSFEKQLSIWNRKARGELAVLGGDSTPIDITTLSERELVFSILRWSALPGASRHHWGTDLDVYDAAARPAGYEIKLVPSEYADGGIFAPLSKWLDARIANGSAFGFYRPYDQDLGGVAAERWHLSCAPLAVTYTWNLTPDLLRQTIEPADMMLKGVVLANLDEIFTWFVLNTNTDAP